MADGTKGVVTGLTGLHALVKRFQYTLEEDQRQGLYTLMNETME